MLRRLASRPENRSPTRPTQQPQRQQEAVRRAGKPTTARAAKPAPRGRFGSGTKRVHTTSPHPTAAQVAARHAHAHAPHHSSVPPSALLATGTDIFAQAHLGADSPRESQSRDRRGRPQQRGQQQQQHQQQQHRASEPQTEAEVQMSERERRLKEQRRVIWMGGRKVGQTYLLVTVYRIPDASHSTDLFAEAYDRCVGAARCLPGAGVYRPRLA